MGAGTSLVLRRLRTWIPVAIVVWFGVLWIRWEGADNYYATPRIHFFHPEFDPSFNLDEATVHELVDGLPMEWWSQYESASSLADALSMREAMLGQLPKKIVYEKATISGKSPKEKAKDAVNLQFAIGFWMLAIVWIVVMAPIAWDLLYRKCGRPLLVSATAWALRIRNDAESR